MSRIRRPAFPFVTFYTAAVVALVGLTLVTAAVITASGQTPPAVLTPQLAQYIWVLRVDVNGPEYGKRALTHETTFADEAECKEFGLSDKFVDDMVELLAAVHLNEGPSATVSNLRCEPLRDHGKPA